MNFSIRVVVLLTWKRAGEDISTHSARRFRIESPPSALLNHCGLIGWAKWGRRAIVRGQRGQRNVLVRERKGQNKRLFGMMNRGFEGARDDTTLSSSEWNSLIEFISEIDDGTIIEDTRSSEEEKERREDEENWNWTSFIWIPSVFVFCMIIIPVLSCEKWNNYVTRSCI